MYEPTTPEGFSRAQMGSERVDEIKSAIKSLKQIENKAGYEFRKLKQRIQYYGSSDYVYRRDDQYRQNYMQALEQAKNFENYDILKTKLDSIKSPRKFFEYVQQSEVLADLFLWYKEGASELGYGGFLNNEDAFNYALEQLGLLEE